MPNNNKYEMPSNNKTCEKLETGISETAIDMLEIALKACKEVTL